MSSTAWFERAFVELAGMDSSEAQEKLRQWVASRQLTMGDYNEMADRLTVAYLDRDTRRARNFEHARETGKLPQAAADPPRQPRTAPLAPLPPDTRRPPHSEKPPALGTSPLSSMEAQRGRKPGWRPR